MGCTSSRIKDEDKPTGLGSAVGALADKFTIAVGLKEVPAFSRGINVIDVDKDGVISVPEALGIAGCPPCTTQAGIMGPIGLLVGLVLGPALIALSFFFVALCNIPSIVVWAYKATFSTVRVGIWTKLWLILTLPILGLLAFVGSVLLGAFAGVVWGASAGFTVFGFCEDGIAKFDSLVNDAFARRFSLLLATLKDVATEKLPLDHPALELSPTAAVTGLLLTLYGVPAGLLTYFCMALYKLPGNIYNICKTSQFLAKCGCFKYLILPPFLVFVLFWELVSLVAVPVYGTLACGFSALSMTYKHNLKFRAAQKRGAHGCAVFCTLIGDILGVNGMINGFASVGIRIGEHCKGKDDSELAIFYLKPLVIVGALGYFIPDAAYAYGLVTGGVDEAELYKLAASAALLALALGVVAVLFCRLWQAHKKIAKAELL